MINLQEARRGRFESISANAGQAVSLVHLDRIIGSIREPFEQSMMERELYSGDDHLESSGIPQGEGQNSTLV